MNAVDTNVFVYRIDLAEPVKQAKAKALLRRLRKEPIPPVLMWQVASELLQRLRFGLSQGRITASELALYFTSVRKSYVLQLPSDAVLDRSLDLASRYSLSHWDSMIVAACIEAGVNTLYTEDMGAPTKIDSLNLINPFL